MPCCPAIRGGVGRIGQFLEGVREIASNREFTTITGSYRGVKVMATSTGIGGASLGIAVEELRRIGVTTLIRIGSCGALQNDLRVGDLIIPSGAVRNEGTSDAYIARDYPALPDPLLLTGLLQTARRLGYPFQCGLVRSHDSFYTDREAAIDRYWAERGILASDMESAPLMVIGGLRKLRTASLLNVVVEAEGSLENGINQYVDGRDAAALGEEREIRLALETIFSLLQE
ncbi:uridine phosphorylase [Hydrogenispora ethanolica]|uniref:Uridine phosphorylase n=1 Tax=Hydrogenispora ethanolica TaxID=1082276 RepID=A0A4R1RR45_HYDET|nr:uridine phosphorylase [Hydrogenispora ethanolica]